jgi:hypothetical protein
MSYDYSVNDSSVSRDADSFRAYDRKDNSLRVGMVRETKTVSDGSTRYVVEMYVGGAQVPISCQLMTRFGGVYNFEEYKVRAWANKLGDPSLLPTTGSSYDFRSGDTVIVGLINGTSREGIILGGIRQEARTEELGDDIEYLSRFNGLETKIDKDGAYTVTFQGTPINEPLLDTPVPPVDPQFNPLTSGSFFGFDSTGSFTIDDNSSSSIVITKDLASPAITITSGQNTISLAGNPALGETTVTTSTLNFSAIDTKFDSKKEFAVETLQLKMKGAQVAIGNDVFELIDGLIQLIDGIGSVVVTSPVGNCTPISAAPTWPSLVIPLQIKMRAIKGSL